MVALTVIPSFNYLFCKRQGKWSEIPYVQAFLALRDREDLCKTCKIDSAVLALMGQSPSSPREDPSELGNAKREPEPDKSQKEKIFKVGDSTKTTPSSIYPLLLLTAPLLPYLGDLTPTRPPPKFCPLVEAMGKFGPKLIQKPFTLLELKQIKQELGKFSYDPTTTLTTSST